MAEITEILNPVLTPELPMKPLLQTYLLVLLLLVVLPLNGFTNTALHTTIVVSIRINSYNVCYTKLLRYNLQPQGNLRIFLALCS